MPITSPRIEFNCPKHGTVKARQYNVGIAEREYFGCGYCKEPHFFPLSSSELRIKTPDQLLTDAQAEIARMKDEVDFWKGSVATANHQRDAANNKADTARNDALEEAARIADNQPIANSIAERIRARKTGDK